MHLGVVLLLLLSFLRFRLDDFYAAPPAPLEHHQNNNASSPSSSSSSIRALGSPASPEEDPVETASVIRFPAWNTAKAIATPQVQDHEVYLHQLNHSGSNASASVAVLGERLPCPVPLPLDPTNTTNHHNYSQNDQQPSPSSQITAIFTGSARYCHPHLDLMQAVWDSHEKYMRGFESMPVLFALDGFGDVGYNRVKMRKAAVAAAHNISLQDEKYVEFKRRLREKYPRAQFMALEENVGQRELVKRAIARVKTPIVYVAQDDFGLVKPVDAESIAVTMINSGLGYNNVRYILLAKRYGGANKRHYKFYGPNMQAPAANAPLSREDELKVYPDREPPLFDTSSVCLPEYSRKVGFYSDNNHFALTELYSKYLLPRASKAKFLEDIHTNPALKQARLWGRYYGTHQYATHQVLDHLDGRDLKWCSNTNASA